LTVPFDGDDLARRIKDSLNIVDVIGSYIELSKRGSRYLALCPFHAEKTPSFSINSVDQFFHCFGCKKSGDVFDFVMAMEGITFVEALSLLGERCGIQVERRRAQGTGKSRSGGKQRLFAILERAACIFEENLQAPPGALARKYLAERQVDPKVSAQFRFGYSTEAWRDLKATLLHEGYSESELIATGLAKQASNGSTYDLFRNRLMIPIFDIQNRVIGFGGRVLDDTLPKYINSPETPVFHKSQSFYGLNFARRSMSTKRYATIMEGYTDVIQAHSRQVLTAIATLGTALTSDHARLLKRLVDRVILLFDGDEAGSAAAGRGVEMLLAEDLDVTVVTLDQGMDPFDFFSHHDANDFAALVRSRGLDFFDFTIQYFSKRYDVSTPGGKTRLIRELMKLVSFHKDVIRKDLLLKKIAGTLGVSEILLRQEFTQEGKRQVPEQTRRDSQHGENRSAVQPARDLTITSSEDDLILGLLKSTELVGRFIEALQGVATDDNDADCILKAICELYETNRFSVSELISRLWNQEDAKARVIALVSDARKSDPEVLVSSALDVLKRNQRRKEYERVRHQSKDLLKEKSSAEADQLLLEISERLKIQKADERKKNN